MRRGWIILVLLVGFFSFAAPVSAKPQKKGNDYYQSGTEYSKKKPKTQQNGLAGDPQRSVKKSNKRSDVPAVPEPSTAMLMLAGMAGLLGVGRRFKKM
ncbi:MAG: hypothetical protein CVU64_12830 [Deltaproteobacteria bacterium HGW-Deltaproteobacteria-21]|jgi:hypothetical protein|nr:MAG: hypothetical protein CVU64_12830 [Deltaproteobacteria bacterium HGW-Deltaproteobacteria-21]